jgi:hypothetical protein
MLELGHAQTQRISNINATNLNKKLASLQDFLKRNTKTKANTKSTCSLVLATLTERIEFVSNRLNDELIKLINYCMSNSSVHDSADAHTLKPNHTESIHSIVSLASSQSKLMSSNLNKPVSSLVVIDLLCLAFQICFDLFLFRVSYLLADLESLAARKSDKVHKKLLGLKQAFFMLISTLLQSINFTSTTQSFKSLINPNQTISSSTASSKQATITSSSFSSYSTLKLLITVLDCFARILYLPSLNQVLEPDSIATCFYLSLVDNMHNMFKKFKIVKLATTTRAARLVNEEPVKMDEDVEIIEPKSEPIDHEMADVDDQSDADEEKEERGESDDNDEDDECLFQLFYHKLIKYFGDVVYSLESNEHRLQSDESMSNQTASQENEPNNQIITTIAADESSTAASIDYKLEKTPFLPTSKSQTDLCNEFLQSQSSADDERKTKSELIKSAEAGAHQALNAANSSLSANDSNGVDAISSSCIQSLQVEFLTKFISYLHNMQFYASLEAKLIAKAESMKSKKVNRNGPRKSTSTHGQKCMCYSNMLVSFLILIDYKFNEKFINGARLDLNECYLSPFKSCTAYLFNQNLDLDETNASDVIKQFDSEPPSVATKAQLLLAKDRSEIEEKSNRFMYLLVMRYSHAFMSLFNDINSSTKKEQDEFGKQKLKLFESIEDDYRLKNFFCLFKLADSNYEDYIELLKLKSENKEGACGLGDLDTLDTTKTGLFNHLFTSLNTQKNLFKSYIENYFESSICSNLA